MRDGQRRFPVLCGAAILLALVVAIFLWPNTSPPVKNPYFRSGDPSPIAFPTIHTGMSFDELKHDPQGGEGFDIGFWWSPKSGPFKRVMAEFANGNLVAAQYHVRPPYSSGFRTSVDAAFARYDQESGPRPGEKIWPLVRGYRLSLDGDRYAVLPVDPEDVMLIGLTKDLKRGSMAAFALLCFGAAASRWRRKQVTQ